MKLSSTASTMMVSVLMPKTVANGSDWGMGGWTLSKNLMAAENRAKRTVLVHMYRWNHTTRGQSDNNAGPIATAIAGSCD
jgi:hypothetical protein